MWILMRKNIAGPEGAALAGEYADASAEMAAGLIEGGHAEAVPANEVDRILADREAIKNHFAYAENTIQPAKSATKGRKALSRTTDTDA